MAKDLNYFKKKILAILKKQSDDAPKEINKALNEIDFIYKSMFPGTFGEIQKSRGYGIGTVREWKGRKYKKIAPGKWRLIYESDGKGARQSIAFLKKAVINAKSTDELLEIVMQNINRFTDKNGRILDIVSELQEAVKSAKAKLNGQKVPETPKTEFKPGNGKIIVGERISYKGRTGKVTKDFGNGFMFVNFDNGGMGKLAAKDLQKLTPTVDEVTETATENAVKQDINGTNEAVQEVISNYKVGDNVLHNGEKWTIERFFNEAGRKMVGLRGKFPDSYHEISIEQMENEQKDTSALSEAMMGNQNAKKDFIEDTAKIAEEAAQMELDKTEFKGLVDRLNELNKEFSANGGYSNRRTTREEDEKRRAAQKEIRIVEEKLRQFRERIKDEYKGTFKIPAVYHDAINEWIKRKAKGQTISAEWLRKKLGGYYSDVLAFGDGYSLSLGDTETIDNPSVRINYEDEYKRPGYVVVDLKEMEEKENYRPRYMPQDDKSFNDVWQKVNNLKEQLNNATGSTIAEKFFNTVMGTSNAYNENSDTANIPRYRFTKDGIKDKGGKLEKIDASLREDERGNEYIRLYADNYGASIPSIFYPENNTDIQTDYFEKDSCSVFPDHPYYNHLKLMALKRELYRGRATKWASLSKEQQTDIENKIKELEKQLKEPTEEELKTYRERRDVQEENKEKWEEARKRVYVKQMEERREKAEQEKVKQFGELLNKFAEALEKEPPVYLGGLSKDEKIRTLEDRIAKLSIEIANLDDEETVEEKKQYREQLSQKLEEVKNEPDTDEKESEIEAHNNRSEAMMGNDNASGFRLVKPEEVEPEEETVEVKEETITNTEEPKDELDTPIPTIDRKVAERINDISMSGSAGNVYQSDVKIEMENFKERFDYDKMNPQQKEYFKERLSSYAGLVGSSYNEMASKRLAAGPSWVVAGPAKYNTKRFNQKMEAERRAYENFEEKKDKFIKNTEKRLKELKYTGGTESVEDVKKKVFDDYSKGKWSYGDKIDNTDPYAIEKIQGKIKYMEDAHDVTLLYNKMCKKNGITNWQWADRTDEDRAKRREVLNQTINAAKEQGYSDEVIKQGIEHPFGQNQTADIRRNKQRLEELQARQSKLEERKASESNGETVSSANTGRVDFDGGYVYENPELDRIQIIYDGKPAREIIDKLKHNGFRWSPSQGAWQRQLNRNGRSAVNRVFEETGINTKIDIDGAGEVTKSFPKFLIKNGRFLIRK